MMEPLKIICTFQYSTKVVKVGLEIATILVTYAPEM